MTIPEAFVEYLVNLNRGIFGADIFIGSLPNEAPNACYWIVSAGGAPHVKNVSGESIKEYILDVYYRNESGQVVYDQLHSLEEIINSSRTLSLGEYTIIDVSTISFPVDRDLDLEDRSVGLLQVALKTYSDSVLVDSSQGVVPVSLDIVYTKSEVNALIASISGGSASFSSLTGNISDNPILQAAFDAKQGVLNGIVGARHKSGIISNVDNDLFTFPLAVNEGIGMGMHGTLKAKKGTDWAMVSYYLPFAFYNDNGTLHVSGNGNAPTDSTGSMISEDINNSGSVSALFIHNQPSATLSGGIVTVTFNPGDVGISPDSITLDYLVICPEGVVITHI